MAGSSQSLRARLISWEDTLYGLAPPIDRMPFLGWLAIAASLADLLLNRLALRLLSAPHATLLHLQWWGTATRNLAACAGFVALMAGSFGLLLHPRALPLWRRLAVASVAGIFTPLIMLAAVLPASGPFQALGPLTAVSGAALTTQFAMTGLRPHGHPATLWGSALLTLTGLMMFAHLAIAITTPFLSSAWLLDANFWLRRGSEVIYLTLGLIVLSTLPHAVSQRVRWLGLGAAAVTGLTAVTLMRWMAPGHEKLGTVLVGALDLHIFVSWLPQTYVLWLGVVLGAGAVALRHPTPAFRQATGALLLLTSSGCFPRTPSRVLMLVVGTLLLVRSAVALSGRRPPKSPVAPDTNDQGPFGEVR